MHSWQFAKIALLGTHDKPQVAQTVSQLYHWLSESASVYIEHQTAASFQTPPKQTYDLSSLAQLCDIAIVVGGDGNFLNAARSLSLYRSVPIVGINRGKLGFLSDIKPQEMFDQLQKILQGDYQQESRFMLTTTDHPFSDNIPSETLTALNEVTFSSGYQARLFEMRVYIDNQYAFDQRSDGLLISTPTGSTAHALSAGGPIMYPSLDAMVIVPMYSHSLNSRPIIIPGDSSVSVEINAYNAPEPVVSFDGHSAHHIGIGQRITVRKCTQKITILHPQDYNYYHTLRTKLHWGKMLFD